MKKILISLFVCVVGFVSFGYCGDIVSSVVSPSVLYFSSGETKELGAGKCFDRNNRLFTLLDSSGTVVFDISNMSKATDMVCLVDTGYIHYKFTSDNVAFSYYDFSSFFITDCPECQSCPEIDTNYCVGNGLCPNECGSGTDLSGDLQYSNLYINNILHPGTPNIFVDIPDYITWDYATTGDDFNIYVGSGYDVDYINSIIDINSYRATSEDFTNIFVSGLTLIFPYIFIALLILFIWKLIKRPFK